MIINFILYELDPLIDPAKHLQTIPQLELPGQMIEAGKFTEDWSTPFTIDRHTRHKFLNGLDDIALTMQTKESVKNFEKSRPFYIDPSVR